MSRPNPSTARYHSPSAPKAVAKSQSTSNGDDKGYIARDPDEDLHYAAFCETRTAVYLFNQHLEAYKNGWERYLVPLLGPLAVSAIAFVIWSSFALSVVVFSMTLLYVFVVPYTYSAEYIYRNPQLAAFCACLANVEPIPMTYVGYPTGRFWKEMLCLHGTPLTGYVSGDMDTSPLVIAAIRELMQETINNTRHMKRKPAQTKIN